MNVGKGPSGLIGVTTNEHAVKVWANSHHHCNSLVTELNEIIDKTSSQQLSHKEEGKGSILSETAKTGIVCKTPCKPMFILLTLKTIRHLP